jgi:hypothetical protein
MRSHGGRQSGPRLAANGRTGHTKPPKRKQGTAPGWHPNVRWSGARTHARPRTAAVLLSRATKREGHGSGEPAEGARTSAATQTGSAQRVPHCSGQPPPAHSQPCAVPLRAHTAPAHLQAQVQVLCKQPGCGAKTSERGALRAQQLQAAGAAAQHGRGARPHPHPCCTTAPTPVYGPTLKQLRVAVLVVKSFCVTSAPVRR